MHRTQFVEKVGPPLHPIEARHGHAKLVMGLESGDSLPSQIKSIDDVEAETLSNLPFSVAW
jgi:hypothetical protein